MNLKPTIFSTNISETNEILVLFRAKWEEVDDRNDHGNMYGFQLAYRSGQSLVSFT